ncbi:IS701 family transposase [Nocardiopsis chromatogenes]|uniref:IS701 family transposase n=1 Tax=Nocardiopsis chromatogenes TaxID=280239 RepID=UPI00034D0C31|nr:transposase [Nocardiopsis chromatogenes]
MKRSAEGRPTAVRRAAGAAAAPHRRAGAAAASSASPASPVSREGRPGTDTLLARLADGLFSSLHRSDQRRKGTDYLRGLLSTPGRKSIRNMAALMGGSGTGQSLHHFICSSTWDWVPVRRDLYAFVEREAPPRAWVVRPMLIPKTGRHSVGVARYAPDSDGPALVAQQAVGVWMASSAGAVPVHWHLHVPDPGEDASGGRDLADASGEPTADRAADACLELLSEWQVPARPVVLEVEGAASVPALRRLRAAGLCPVARIPGDLPLRVTDPTLVGHTGAVLPAQRIIAAARELRRPVRAVGGAPQPSRAPTPSGPGRPRVPVRRPAPPELAATVRTALPGTPPSRRPDAEYALVGFGASDPDWPRELWLTALPAQRAAAEVPYYSRLARLTEHQQRTVGDRVGLRDYAGRSFAGWHRHATLASAAHAAALLSAWAPPGPT